MQATPPIPTYKKTLHTHTHTLRHSPWQQQKQQNTQGTVNSRKQNDEFMNFSAPSLSLPLSLTAACKRDSQSTQMPLSTQPSTLVSSRLHTGSAYGLSAWECVRIGKWKGNWEREWEWEMEMSYMPRHRSRRRRRYRLHGNARAFVWLSRLHTQIAQVVIIEKCLVVVVVSPFAVYRAVGLRDVRGT